MLINTGTSPKLLWPGIYGTWGQEYNAHEKEYERLFEIRDSDKSYEELVELTGFNLAQQKNEGGNRYYDRQVQGVIARAVHVPYTLGYIVSYEAERDNLYKEVADRRARANAFSINATIETIGANFYNYAFTSTGGHAVADGQALISTAHVQPLGGTFSNELSGDPDLSEAALEDISTMIMNVKTSRGLPFSAYPVSLHIAPNEWWNANRALGSVLKSGGADNDLNVLHATGAFPGGIHVNHYFTSAHAWFVRTNVPDSLLFFWRDRPMFTDDGDWETMNHKYGCYFRCSVVAGDVRGIFGSNA